MALYANALSKYQNYLSGDESKKFQGVAAPEPTRDQPLGSDPSRQPAPQQPPAGAPSVPTSTNAEQTDFRSYDQNPAMGTALTGTVAPEAQSDPYADLLGAYEEPERRTKPVVGADDVDAYGGKGAVEAGLIDADVTEYEEPVDNLVEQALRDLLEGRRDTTEDEATIRENTRAGMLEGVVDNQARAGALGFGASGALAGMDADIRGRAERSANDQIMGVRGDAEDDWLRRVGTGLGADLTRREYASRESARDAYADLLNEMMGPEEDEIRSGDPSEEVFTDIEAAVIEGGGGQIVNAGLNINTAEEALASRDWRPVGEPYYQNGRKNQDFEAADGNSTRTFSFADGAGGSDEDKQAAADAAARLIGGS